MVGHSSSLWLFYHGNHVVKCKWCSCYLLVRRGCRLYGSGETKDWFSCMVCAKQFSCCSRSAEEVNARANLKKLGFFRY